MSTRNWLIQVFRGLQYIKHTTGKYRPCARRSLPS
jgi:hypothetical protein